MTKNRTSTHPKTLLTPDRRHTNRGAPEQPRTQVADASRGTAWQPRTTRSQATRGKTLSKFQALNICTYNVRTLNKENNEHFTNLEKELELGFKWDIIGLSETKIKGCYQEPMKHGHLLYNCGVPTTCPAYGGVGFIINKKHTANILELKGISERLALLKLKGKHNNQYYVQCYAPQSKRPEEEVEQFYILLQDLIDNIPQRDDLFVIGDFNAKVGGLNSQYPEIVGMHSNVKGGHNKRGKKLMTFCSRNSLAITNTFFKHRRKYTWVSPDGKTLNTVDYILVRRKMLHSVTDAHTVACVDISDHRLVRCKVRLSLFKPPKKIKPPSYNLVSLQDEGIRAEFQNKIRDHLERNSSIDQSSPTELNRMLTQAVKTSADEVLPKRGPQQKEWITQDTIEAIKMKNDIRSKLGKDAITYKLHKANVKKMCRADFEAYIDEEHRELDELAPQQKYFNTMKRLKNARKKKQSPWSVKASDGTQLTNLVEILERWASYYETLYSGHQDPSIIITSEIIPEILLEEVRLALRMLKHSKAAGPDGIFAELLKFGGEHVEELLLKLFNIVIKTLVFPNEFKESEIMTIYKKGDILNCDNHRPITLLNQVYKILAQIIYRRIAATLRESLPSTQAAYQPGRSAVEQIQSLQQIIEKSKEFNIEGFICFVDYRKAFDSIDQSKLWKILQDCTNLSPAYINFLIKVYEGSSATIRTSVGNTRLINILKGVKQGDVLSAILFCLVISVITYKAFNNKNYGLPIGGILWSDLSYADDLAVVAENKAQLVEMIEKLAEESAYFGLKINFSKTKIMPIGPQAKLFSDNNIKIIGKKIDVVSNFQYLGRILNNMADDTAAVEHRIAKGWQVFQNKKTIITHRRLSMKAKKQTVESYILPSVLYASETVTWTNTLLTKMKVFQNHLMRWMTGFKLNDRVPISRLTSLTKLDDISTTIKRMKLKWYGHVRRSSIPAKIVMEGLAPGFRKRGRPSRRWMQDLTEWTRKDIRELAPMVYDRDEWRRLCNQVS